METSRNRRWILPTLGIIAALATNTIANMGVLPAVGALVLLPLLVIFWYIERFARRDMGFVAGRLHHYGLGLLHPVLVLSLIALDCTHFTEPFLMGAPPVRCKGFRIL
jgi:hypothetical protein